MKVVTNIENIRNSFQKGNSFKFDLSEPNNLISFIDSFTLNLVPVVLEGVSASVASKLDVTLNPSWVEITKLYDRLYAKHLYIGLGWAISESALSLEILEQIDAKWRWRVVDGFGYRTGLFQRRKIQRSQFAPSEILPEWESAFFQGFGRSLWYISQGNIEQLVKSINTYPPEALSDIWRGVGIAFAFVGGVDNSLLINISTIGEQNLKSFKQGVALILSSKPEPSAEVEKIGDFFFQDRLKAKKFTQKVESGMNESGTNYSELIDQHYSSLSL